MPNYQLALELVIKRNIEALDEMNDYGFGPNTIASLAKIISDSEDFHEDLGKITEVAVEFWMEELNITK
jgi:hypothetical protein